MLLAAGSSNIWVTPKTKEGGIDHSWKLIWPDNKIEPHEVALTIAKLPDAAGIVKIKGRFAVRIAKEKFADAWAILNPGIAQPDLLDATTTWRIKALPYGITRDNLTEWSRHVQWQIKPLRASGPRAWVVGAVNAPPTKTLYFNSEPLLIREVTAKPPPLNFIIEPALWYSRIADGLRA